MCFTSAIHIMVFKKKALNTLLCGRVHENQWELRTNLNMICLIFLKPLPTGKKKNLVALGPVKVRVRLPLRML